MKRGHYIILEGGEGCGKSTQAKLLCEYLNSKGIPCVLTREPGGTKEGHQIREILTNKENELSPLSELFLFQADRTESYLKIVKPNLEKGVVVVKDRSRFSTEAHQGYAGETDMQLIKELNSFSTQKISPDLLIIIDIEHDKGLEKEEDANRFAAKGGEYHKKVNEYYRALADKFDFAVLIPYQDENPGAMQEEIRRHLKERLGI